MSTSWTHDRLGALLGLAIPLGDPDHERIENALLGLAIPLGDPDHERIENALLEAAHAFGPAPSRPAHRWPRTPGRRALLVGRLMAHRAKMPR